MPDFFNGANARLAIFVGGAFILGLLLGGCTATPYANKAAPGFPPSLANPDAKQFDGQFGGNPNVDAGVKK